MEQSKKELFDFSEFLLKKIFANKMIIKNNRDSLEIIANNSKKIITTKYELKNYLRDFLSEKNSYVDIYFTNLIKIRYEIKEKNKEKLLNEIYPNIDVLISAYINLMRSDYKIKIKKFDYDKLFEHLIKEYILILKEEESPYEITYNMYIKEMNKLEKNIKKLENDLKIYQLVKKNKFYYETYQNYVVSELEDFEEEKMILKEKIKQTDGIINENQKKYRILEEKNNKSVRTNIKRINQMDKYQEKIEISKLEKIDLEKKLNKILLQNKNNLSRNNDSFSKYIEEDKISIEKFSEYYEKTKNKSGIDILKRINLDREKSSDLKNKLKQNNYQIIHNKLRFFCLDNLKIIKKNVDMDPNIIKRVIEILTINSK